MKFNIILHLAAKVNIQRKDDTKFIKTVLKYVKADQDCTYLYDLKSLDYKKISKDLDGMPIEECKSKLKKIIRPLTKRK